MAAETEPASLAEAGRPSRAASFRSQGSFRRSSSQLLAQDSEADPEAASLKRQNSLEKTKESPESPECLRARTPAGGMIMSMTRSQVSGARVAKLRELLSARMSRCKEELKLFASMRELEDAESLEDMVAQAEQPFEVMIVTSLMPQIDPDKTTLEQLDTVKNMVLSSSPEYQLDAVTRLRKILSVENNPHIDEVLTMGIVGRLVELANDSDNDQVVAESLWALTNIAAGDAQHCSAVVDAGVIPVLAKHLSSGNEDHKEQAFWALGNLAGDSHTLRDAVLEADVVEPFRKALEDPASLKPSLLRHSTWSLSNLFRGKPKPNSERLAPLLSVLPAILLQIEDNEVLSDACWALSYATDGDNDDIDRVLQLGMLQRLVALLAHESPVVVTPVLRTLGNVVSGEDKQTQAALDAGILGAMPAVLTHHKKNLRKEGAWLISNITAGTPAQVDAVLETNLLQIMYERMHHEDSVVSKEIAFAVANASDHKRPEAMIRLVEMGWLEKMTSLIIDGSNPSLIEIVLGFIENVLQVGVTQHDAVDKSVALDRLRAVLPKDNLEAFVENGSLHEDITQKAARVLELCYGDAEEEQEAVDGFDAAAS